MNDKRNEETSDLDFTRRARASFFTAIKDPYFRDGDYDLIYALLKGKMKIVFFGDFLKRYIYEKAELKGNYQSIPISQYQEIICSEFSDRQTPCSFTPTTMRLKNAAKNWLEQQTVNRSVVLLLGFGLGMSEEDVNRFLNKALQEPELNAKDPLEAICAYCYRKGLGYLAFDALWDAYKQRQEAGAPPEPSLDATIGYKKRLSEVRDENELMAFLAELPIIQGTRRQSITARRAFDRLYGRARALVAQILTETEKDDAGKMAERLEGQLSGNDRLYDYQKLERIRNEKESYTVYSPDDVGAADIESVILSAVPRDAHGNLVPMKKSTLNQQFVGKRLTRQHLGEILAGKAPVTRYDLITLNFFVLSQAEGQTRKERYSAFIESTNAMLNECGFGPLYIVHPYECFLLMCMASDDPLGTYADVWELSYDEGE